MIKISNLEEKKGGWLNVSKKHLKNIVVNKESERIAVKTRFLGGLAKGR